MRAAFATLMLAALASASMSLADGDEAVPPRSPRWATALGLGPAFALENTVFNLPGDRGLRTGGELFAGARYCLGRHWAVGARAEAVLATTRSRYGRQDLLSLPETARYSLQFADASLELRYTISRERWEHYAFLCGGFTNTTASVSLWNDIVARGYAGGGGAGIGYVTNSDMAFGLEGQVMAGDAKWERLPYPTSAGRGFNPGYVAIHLYYERHWGEAD